MFRGLGCEVSGLGPHRMEKDMETTISCIRFTVQRLSLPFP